MELWVKVAISGLLMGVGGSFTLITYAHKNFLTYREMQPIYKRLDRIEDKIDKLIDR